MTLPPARCGELLSDIPLYGCVGFGYSRMEPPDSDGKSPLSPEVIEPLG